MSKYQPLADFLRGHGPDEWRVTFAALEKALGFDLPKTAREKSGWWSNADAAPKPHAKAWLDAGWMVGSVDLAGGKVVFRRAAPAAKTAPDPTAHQVMAAADAEFTKAKAVDTAKKVGVAAALLGVVAGVGLVVRGLLGRSAK